MDLSPSRGMWDTCEKAQLAAGFPARHSDWEDSDNNLRHKQLQEFHFCSLNMQCTYIDLADLVRSEGNSFLFFFYWVLCIIMSKEKITAEETPEQYPELQNFVISAVLLLEFASTPYTQIISTYSCNSPTPQGSSGSRCIQLGTVQPSPFTPFLAEAAGKVWTCPCCESEHSQGFHVTSENSVVTPVALERQSGFRGTHTNSCTWHGCACRIEQNTSSWKEPMMAIQPYDQSRAEMK